MVMTQSSNLHSKIATAVEIWHFSLVLQRESDIKIQYKMLQQYNFLTLQVLVEQSVWISKYDSYNRLVQESVQVQEIIEAWASDERVKHHQSKEIRKNRVDQTVQTIVCLSLPSQQWDSSIIQWTRVGPNLLEAKQQQTSDSS